MTWYDNGWSWKVRRCTPVKGEPVICMFMRQLRRVLLIVLPKVSTSGQSSCFVLISESLSNRSHLPREPVDCSTLHSKPPKRVNIEVQEKAVAFSTVNCSRKGSPKAHARVTVLFLKYPDRHLQALFPEACFRHNVGCLSTSLEQAILICVMTTNVLFSYMQVKYS
jgi:hypothetical protein